MSSEIQKTYIFSPACKCGGKSENLSQLWIIVSVTPPICIEIQNSKRVDVHREVL